MTDQDTPFTETAVCLYYWKETGGYSGLVRLPGSFEHCGWRRIKNLGHVRKPGWKRFEGPVTKAMQRALVDHSTPMLDARKHFPCQLVYHEKGA